MLKESQLNKAQVSRQCRAGEEGKGEIPEWLLIRPPPPRRAVNQAPDTAASSPGRPPASSCEDRRRPPRLCRASPRSPPAAGAAASCRLTPACSPARSSPIMMQSWIRTSSGDELRSVRTSWACPRTVKIKTWCLQKENICSAGSGPQRGNFLCV